MDDDWLLYSGESQSKFHGSKMFQSTNQNLSGLGYTQNSTIWLFNIAMENHHV